LRPAKAYLYAHNWIGQRHSYDPYWWIGNIEVFEEGTDATVTVTVYNDEWWNNQINISDVIVEMDWGINYSSTEVSQAIPYVMPYATYHTFTVTFLVPSISVASNFVSHGYRLIVEEVNATTGPKQKWTHSWSTYSSGFYVYSSVQKEAMVLYDEVRALESFVWWSFDSIEARNMWYDGEWHSDLGMMSYQSGDFDDARTHWTSALSLMNQAYALEQDYDQDWADYYDDYDQQWDDLYLQEMEAEVALAEAEGTARLIEANATMKSAEADMIIADAQLSLAQAAMTQAYAWIVFGIGFIIFGIAAVVWAF
jgi:hypothetical protein